MTEAVKRAQSRTATSKSSLWLRARPDRAVLVRVAAARCHHLRGSADHLHVHLRGSTDHLLVGDLGLGVEEEAENQLQKSSQHGCRGMRVSVRLSAAHTGNAQRCGKPRTG